VTDPNFACKNCGLSPIILIPLVPDTRNGFNFLNQSTLTLLICLLVIGIHSYHLPVNNRH
jgi:hypothetical protein